jgi:predicted peptidase
MKTQVTVMAVALAGAAAWMMSSATAEAQAPAPAAKGKGFAQDPRAQTRTYRFEEANMDMPYSLYVSTKVDRTRPAPLIVTLHGLGAPQTIMMGKTAVDLAEEGGYVLVAPMGYNTGGWYGSPVIAMGGGKGKAGAPEAPANLSELSEKDVMNVIALVRKEFNIDDKRMYLMGHSMGGAGTLWLGSKYASMWAAIAPVAPAAFRMNDSRKEILQKIKDAGVAVMVVTGDADELVPVANTRMWVETLKELGIPHEYVEQPGVTHGPVIETSLKPIYEFFSKHAKK